MSEIAKQSHPAAAPQPPNSAHESANADKNGWILVGAMTAVVIYAYWNTLMGTAVAWSTPMYNHGYLIPLIALMLLYMRRQPFSADVDSKERWWGVGTIVAATAIRVFASQHTNFTADRASLILCLFGVFLFVGGVRTIRWAGPPILIFLPFMFPWPDFLVDNILRPMQKIATASSVYALQTLGVESYRDGNRIELEHSALNVVEQCSGLRMLTIFIALSIAVAMISNNRPMWERLVIVFPSSLMIAVLVNCIRITVTGLFYNSELKVPGIDAVFHDAPGWFMMPLAMGFLFLEMQILSRLVIEDDSASAPPQIGGHLTG